MIYKNPLIATEGISLSMVNELDRGFPGLGGKGEKEITIVRHTGDQLEASLLDMPLSDVTWVDVSAVLAKRRWDLHCQQVGKISPSNLPLDKT